LNQLPPQQSDPFYQKPLFVAVVSSLLLAFGAVSWHYLKKWERQAEETVADDAESRKENTRARHLLRNEVLERMRVARPEVSLDPGKAWLILNGEDSRVSEQFYSIPLWQLIDELQKLRYNWHKVDSAKIGAIAKARNASELDALFGLLDSAFPQ
jgi:hypothetical protein